MVNMLCFDLGASSGRVILQTYTGSKLIPKEMHRFPNNQVNVLGTTYWDVLHIYQQMKDGITKTIQSGYSDISSMGIDTWGVDFGLIGKEGLLLSNPQTYRNSIFSQYMTNFLKGRSKQDLYEKTGVYPDSINTIFQLYTLYQQHPRLVEQIDSVLLMPSLLQYFFSGEKVNEYTIASTTGLLDYRNQNWNQELLSAVGLKSEQMAPVVPSGTMLGNTMSMINEELGINPIKMIASGGHDSACAVAALPYQTENSLFLLSGTWVIIGTETETETAFISEESLQSGFTNEGTVTGKYRFIKNNMGLFMLQQMERVWEKEGDKLDYQSLPHIIQKTKPFKALINPEAEQFFNPDNMVDAIRVFCADHNETIPETRGEYIRTILESLALQYRHTIEQLGRITNKKFDSISMAGGGCQNTALCQFIANATQLPVFAGPIEASSLGNGIVQLKASGELNSLAEGKELIKQSYDVVTYEPKEREQWDEAYHRFQKLTNSFV